MGKKVVALAVALAALAVPAYLLLRDDSPSPGATSPPAAGAGPRTFFAVTEAGAIVVADASNGRVTKTLVGARALAGRLRTIVPSPDRTTLYFVIHRSDDCSEIASVPAAGGPVRVLMRGDGPSPSPDGRSLAYVDLLNCGGMRARVVLRDLTTGAERAWEEKAVEGQLFPRLAAIGATWSPDPRSLIVGSCGADACGPWLLDVTSAPGDVWRAAKPMPGEPDPGRDAFWGCWTARGSKGTVVVRTDYSSSDGTEPHPIKEIDIKTGRVSPLVAVGRELRCLTFDASGDHALFVRDGGAFAWSSAGGPRLIGRGFTEAAW